MKKTIAILAALATALSLAACSSGNGGEGENSSSTTPAATTTTSQAEESEEPEETAEAETTTEAETEASEIVPEYVEPAAAEFTYKYDADLGGVEITKYSGSAEAIRIPAELDGSPVKRVSLRSNEKITYVELPYSVTEINEFAFQGCINLARITIPSPVNSPVNSLVHGPVNIIPMGAFIGCISLTEITIPEGTKEICDGAFSGCTNLTSVTLPDSLMHIDNNAFGSCTSLRSLTVPDGTTIHRSAFKGCNGLTVTYKGEQYTYANAPDYWWGW